MGGKWWKIHEDLSQNGRSWLIPRLQPAPLFFNRKDAKALRKMIQEPSLKLNLLSNTIIGSAIEVHRILGPAFLESVYEEALCIELISKKVNFTRQVAIPLQYKGHVRGENRLDLLIDEELIIELKAVEMLAPIHIAQVISYLKATGLHLGLLINFNVPILKKGIKRIVKS